MRDTENTFVAITGAQGVGKSTFCATLRDRLVAEGVDATLLAGLGAALTASGYTMGAHADERAVAAVAWAHLKRERDAPAGLVLLDRCLIDMLAYMRILNVNSPPYTNLYEELVRAIAPRLRLVIFLEMSPTFAISSADHETPEFRKKIDLEIRRIIGEVGVNCLSLDASHSNSETRAALAVRELMGLEDATHH